MIAAREASVAMPTLERFRASVLAIVARQLVGTRESPLATLPAALVRLLSCVRPLMGFQMRALGVYLLATRKLAFVYPALRIRWTVLVAPRVVPVSYGARSCSCPCVCMLRASNCGVTIRCDGDQSCDTLRVAGGNPDDGAPAARPMKVEVLHIEHRTPARRVTGVGMTLTRARARRWCQDLTFAFAAAILFLLDFLVFLVLFEVLAGFFLENKRRARNGG